MLSDVEKSNNLMLTRLSAVATLAGNTARFCDKVAGRGKFVLCST